MTMHQWLGLWSGRLHSMFSGSGGMLVNVTVYG